MIYLVVLFFICVGGCSLLAKIIGNSLFGKSQQKDSFIDKSVHHHYYDNRSVHVDKEAFKKLKP